jgi:hypothetical protein
MTGRHPRDYYRASAPPRSHQPATGLPATGLDTRREGRPRDGSHVHHAIDQPVRRPALPRQHRHAYAAGIQRGLPTAGTKQLRSQARPPARTRALHTVPYPPGLRTASLLRGVCHWFALAAPSGLARQARTVWQYQHVPPSSGAACRPPRRPPARAAPQLHQAAATARWRRSPTSTRSARRLVAHSSLAK